MKVGDVYLFETDKALGFDSRKKYHVFICAGDWLVDHTFLFLSKADYGGDFAITRETYPFLTLDVSFISCGSIVTYSDDELVASAPRRVGRLTQADVRALHDAIAASQTMEGRHILRLCKALRAAF